MNSAQESGRRLDGRVVMVTGGAGGIGQAQVRAAVESGARAVVIADVDAERGSSLAALLGDHVSSVGLDVSSETSWHEAVRHATDLSGHPVDVLLHTAGIIRTDLLAEHSTDEFRQVIDTNLTGFFLGLKAVVPGMTEVGRGSVLAISSVDAFAAVPSFGAYAAAKAGLLALVRAAAIELAPQRIRVNAIAPGAIDSPMTRAEGDGPEVLASFAAQIPWGRVGLPDDIAKASMFLASDEAEFCTGTTLTVDGGSMARISLSLDNWDQPPLATAR